MREDNVYQKECFEFSIICNHCHSTLKITEFLPMTDFHHVSVAVGRCPKCYQILNKLKENTELITKLTKGEL
jgi:hypothetical protein